MPAIIDQRANASSTHRSKTARSLSRSRNRAVAGASERRGAERSPSLEREVLARRHPREQESIEEPLWGLLPLPTTCMRITFPLLPRARPLHRLPSARRWACPPASSLNPSMEPLWDHKTLRAVVTSTSTSPIEVLARTGATGNRLCLVVLPTPLNFHHSMAPLEPSDTSRFCCNAPAPHRQEEAFNRSCFRVHAVLEPAGLNAVSEVSDTQALQHGQDATGHASEASQAGEPKATSGIEAAKAQQGELAGLARQACQGYQGGSCKHDLKKTSSEEPQHAEEDDDEDDDEDEQPASATGGKSEAEAKKLAEKRRKRRESHNAVERRRRDNINEKITELATLLPEAMLLDAIATSDSGR